MRTPPTSLRALLVVPAALAFASTIAPTAALGAEPGPDALPMHVITIQSSEADDQAEGLTKALRTAVRNMPGWSLAPGDYSLEVLALSLKCTDPPDATCQSRIADQIKTDRFVWGTLKKKGAVVTGGLHFWVRGKGTTDVPLEYASNLTDANDDAVKRVAQDALSQVTGGPPRGGVHVKTEGNVSGQLFVDGQPLAAIKGEGNFMIPAGQHTLTVKATGYLDAEAHVTVRPAAQIDLNLALVQAGEANGTNRRRIIGYSAIGAGGLFAILGIVSSAQVKSSQSSLDTLRNNNYAPTSFDWCGAAGQPSAPAASTVAAASSACSKGKTFGILQAVFYPLAAVGVGVGAYLVVTSGKSTPKTTGGLRVSPELGPKDGRVDVAYTF